MYLYNREFVYGSNILVASLTLLVFETLITLGEEINNIWLQPWHSGNILYYLNRWLPLLDCTLALFIQMSPNLTPELCKPLAGLVTAMLASGIIVSEVIILLRTWAMWQRNKTIMMVFAIMTTCTCGPGLYVTTQVITRAKFAPTPAGGVGCNLVEGTKLITISFSLLALSETVVVTLMGIKGYQYVKNSNSHWVRQIYRNGFVFYAVLLAITLVNVITPNVASQPHYKNWLVVPLRVFHSIFCNRVILLLGRQRSYSSGVLATITKADLSENITPVMRASAAHRMRRPVASAVDNQTEHSTFQDIDDGDQAFTLRSVDEEQSVREQHEMETYYERRRKDRLDQY